MRVVVREPGGLLGSADRRFDVRRFDATGVAASDLVLGAATGSLPVKAVAYKGEALAGLVELYARRPDDFANVTVTAQLASLTGEAASSVHAELAETRTREDGSLSREARLLLPLDTVAPGDYVVRATVREGGETIAELTREVQVLPGNAPATGSTRSDAGEDPAAIGPEDVLGGEIARRYVRSLVDAARGTPHLGPRPITPRAERGPSVEQLVRSRAVKLGSRLVWSPRSRSLLCPAIRNCRRRLARRCRRAAGRPRIVHPRLDPRLRGTDAQGDRRVARGGTPTRRCCPPTSQSRTPTSAHPSRRSRFRRCARGSTRCPVRRSCEENYPRSSDVSKAWALGLGAGA